MFPPDYWYAADAAVALLIFTAGSVIALFAYLFKVKADKEALKASTAGLQKQIDDKASKDSLVALDERSKETREDVRAIRSGMDTLIHEALRVRGERA